MVLPVTTEADAILRDVIESTGDLILAVDAQSLRVLACNSAVRRHFKERRDQEVAAGVMLDEFLGPEEAAHWRSLFMRALHEGAFSVEFDGLVKGRVHWLTFDRLVEGGACLGASLVARDITSLRRTPGAPTCAESLLTQLFRASPSALRLTKLESGVVLDANDSFCALTGYERSELLGRTVVELGLWLDATERERVVSLLRAEGRVRGLEVRYRHRDGHALSCLLDCDAVDVDGHPCVIVSTTDITAIRAAERALAVSNLRCRTLIESAPDAILVIDTDSIQCVQVNENACRLFGCQRSELLQLPLAELSPPTQPDGTPSTEAAAIHFLNALAGETRTFEWVHRRIDGRLVESEIRLTRLPDETRRLVRASVIDISEKKRLEREASALRTQLEQAARLESLGALAGRIAHDFNNILGAMLGYLDLALTKASDDSMRDLLKDIEAGALRATDLVNQILTFSRRGPTTNKNPIEVGPVAREALRLIRAGLSAAVTVSESYASSARVLADATQIHQVVMNLCTNARAAMKNSGGALSVTVDEQEASPALLASNPGLRPGRYVRLTVADTGPGISPEIQHRIFEPFFTTWPQGEGTGLGLSVVYGIVKDAGGSIQVTSELGKGTTFAVFLPICAEP